MITSSVGAVLRSRGSHELLSLSAKAPVSEAVSIMKRHSAGSVVILDEQGRVEGIFTERDLMFRVVDEGRDPKATTVGSVMTGNVRRVQASDTVEEALRLLVQHHYRHLLVEEGGQVLGLVSIRDLMTWVVMPDEPIAHEGRPGVVKARTEDALRGLAGQRP